MSESKNTLFPETEVEGYKVKPWSLGTVEELTPVLERITIVLIKKGITLENAKEEIPKVTFSILPEVSAILSITLKEDITKVKELPLNSVITLLLTIITQNISYLKNSYSPMKSLIENLTKTV